MLSPSIVEWHVSRNLLTVDLYTDSCAPRIQYWKQRGLCKLFFDLSANLKVEVEQLSAAFVKNMWPTAPAGLSYKTMQWTIHC